MSDLNTEILISANAEGVEAGVGRAKKSLSSLGDTAQKIGKNGADGMQALGAGADMSARKVESATKNMVGSLQRQIAAMEAGDKTSRKYQETLARMRGVDVAALKPYLDQLDSLQNKTTLVARAQESLNGVMLKGAAAFAVAGAIAGYVKVINDGVDALNDLKDATGASIENISALEDVGKRAGASFDVVSTSLIKFNNVLSDAKPGSAAEQAITALGLSIEDLKRLDPAEALRQTSVALNRFADDGDKARLVQELFGKSVKEVAPFLKDLAESGALVAKVTTEQAEQAEKFNKELSALGKNAQDASRALVGPMVSALNDVIAKFKEGREAGKSFLEIANSRYWSNIRDFYGMTQPAAPSTGGATGSWGDGPDTKPSVGPLPDTKKPKGPTKAELSEYDKLIQKLGVDLPKAAAEAEAAQMGYNKAQAEFLALAGSGVWAKFTSSQRANVAALFENKIASEQAGDAARTLAKANTEAAQARERYLASLETGLDKIQADIAAQIESTERMGLTKEAIADLDAAKLEMLATDLELQAIKAMDRNLDQQTYDALKQQAQAYRDLGKAKKAGAAKDAALDMEKANAEAAKKAQEDWERAAEQINNTLTDALMRGFESGKDFAKNLGDTVINMFKTMVLRPVISAIVNPVAGAVTSALGLSGAQGGGNSIMGGIQTASNLNTLYGAGSQALFGGAAGASAASLGYANIVGMAGGDAIGALAAANGMWAGVATGAQAAAQAAIASNAAMAAGTAAALPAGTTAAAAGAGAGGASGALAAIPGWGWALAGVATLAALWDDDSGTLHTGAKAQYSAADGLATTGEGGKKEYGLNVGMVYDKNTADFVGGVAKGLTETFDGLAVAFGQKAGYQVATAFADDTSKDGAWGALRISKDGKDLLNWEDTRTSRWAPKEFGDGEAGYKEYLAAVAKDTRQVLLDMDLPSWADKMLESIGESASMEQLSATVQQIAAIKTQFVQLGKAMEMFDGIPSGMESALLRAAGSIDALTASAAGYYDAVYTEQEKIARARTQLETTLAGYGQSLPATREQYRALVEQQMAAGESGAEFAVVLMGLAGTFAQVADDIDAQFAEIGKSASEVFEKLLADIGRVRGDVAGTRADMLASAQVMTPAQIAAAVNAAMVYAPATAGIVSAQGGVASAAALAYEKQAAARAAMDTSSASGVALSALQSRLNTLANQKGAYETSLQSQQTAISNLPAVHTLNNSGEGEWIAPIVTKKQLASIETIRGVISSITSEMSAVAEQIQQQQAAYDSDSVASAQYAAELAAANAALAAAQRAEVQARVDYAAQVSQFITAAGGSVNKLSGLREEVVRYYEAQGQAVQSMIATAENLRNVVGSIRMGQLDSAQTASQLGSSYAMDYSMALATTGSTRAGYADSMASALPTLVEAIKAEASTASDWRVQSGKLLAQATGVAGLVDADASGTDYKTTSLGLLDSIDTALAQLEGSTKSAEQVIAQAINDGTAAQLTGLRAIVAALRGESVPAFATGGSFGGGIRLVGENGPELEVTGPSRIYSASQTAAMLSGGGNANAELVAELRALRADNQAQAAAMVNMQRELNKLMLHWDSQGMPEERIV